MKMCEPHWAQLRKAIDDRGMSGLVARNGEDAAAALARAAQGEDLASDFDPLMGANFAIWSTFLKGAGLAGLGDCCPLCEVDKSQPGLATDWIDGASDDQLVGARYHGLVPPPQ